MGRAASALADGVERALEGVTRAGSADKQLADGRLRIAGNGAERRTIEGNGAPAEHALAMVHHRSLEDRLLVTAARRLTREETHRHGVIAGRGQFDAVLG